MWPLYGLHFINIFGLDNRSMKEILWELKFYVYLYDGLHLKDLLQILFCVCRNQRPLLSSWMALLHGNMRAIGYKFRKVGAPPTRYKEDACEGLFQRISPVVHFEVFNAQIQKEWQGANLLLITKSSPSILKFMQPCPQWMEKCTFSSLIWVEHFVEVHKQ